MGSVEETVDVVVRYGNLCDCGNVDDKGAFIDIADEPSGSSDDVEGVDDDRVDVADSTDEGQTHSAGLLLIER